MNEYHKIQTVFLRDQDTNHKTLIRGAYALPEFRYLADNRWVFTEKVDGTNIRVMWDGDSVTFGGKTDNASIPALLVKRLQERFPAQLFAEQFGGTAVCLYGEGYGAKIQGGGGNYRQDQDFVMFDVKIGDWWLTRDNVDDIAKTMGIDVVPIVGTGTLREMVDIVERGFTSQWGDFIAEGVVARPAVELFSRGGQRIITKIKYSDFRR